MIKAITQEHSITPQNIFNENRRKRNINGNFIRIHNIWSPDNTNDGYIDADGRFRVYLPQHPKAYNEGYMLRSVIHYEYFHNDIVLPGQNIHHKDGNRLNDSKENLIKLTHSQHTSLHNQIRIKNVKCICKNCKQEFYIKPYRLKQKDEHRGSFCSQNCYHQYPKTAIMKNNVSNALRRAHAKRKGLLA